jgi:hypothetical protein
MKLLKYHRLQLYKVINSFTKYKYNNNEKYNMIHVGNIYILILYSTEYTISDLQE